MTAPSLPETPAWMEQSLCSQVDPELWFQEKGGSSRPAINTCRRCPVMQECLEHALDNCEVHGIWGATTPQQRRRLGRTAA